MKRPGTPRPFKSIEVMKGRCLPVAVLQLWAEVAIPLLCRAVLPPYRLSRRHNLQYYEGSDSCSRSPLPQASPLISLTFPNVTPPNHGDAPNIALSAFSAYSVRFRLRHLPAGSPTRPAESSSSPADPRLLPTPPHGDAVTGLGLPQEGLSPCCMNYSTRSGVLATNSRNGNMTKQEQAGTPNSPANRFLASHQPFHSAADEIDVQPQVVELV